MNHEEFWDNVEVTTDDGCWLWTGSDGAQQGGAYGKFKGEQAHRWSYAHSVPGGIPDGLEVDHLCRVRLCVRPDHLEAVTHAENMRRTRLAICKKGLHSLDDLDNVYVRPDTLVRSCRPCRNQTSGAWHKEQKLVNA